jgi:glucosamine--fructose-6-phosphate aminotransferase (isomerizing)
MEDTLKVDLSVINGRYLEEILGQPEALRATWTSLRNHTVLDEIKQLRDKDRFPRVILTGMGSSYFGMHPLSIELGEDGWTPILMENSELIHHHAHLLKPSSLVIAVSQSGQSAETVRLLERFGGECVVIGVTNNRESALAKQAKLVLLTEAGQETSVSCKTYVTALMTHEALGAALSGKDLAQRMSVLEGAADLVEAYLRGWKEHVVELSELLQGVRNLYLTGRGRSLAAAGLGALMVKEAVSFQAEGMSSAAFRHGPMEMAKPETLVLVMEGEENVSALNRKLVADIRDRTGRAELIGPSAEIAALRLPSVSVHLLPILEILTAQMLTLALAALAGQEAGKFAHATKVTSEE